MAGPKDNSKSKTRTQFSFMPNDPLNLDYKTPSVTTVFPNIPLVLKPEVRLEKEMELWEKEMKKVRKEEIEAFKKAEIAKRTFKITDARKIRATTGQPMRPKSDFLTGYYDPEIMKEVIGHAKNYNVDPYTALAIGLGETKFGQSDPNIGHVLFNTGTSNPSEDLVRGLIEKTKYADNFYKRHNLGKPSEEAILQAYQGYGIVTPRTEKNYHGFEMDKIFGVPIPKEGLNMLKTNLKGKDVIDIKENVLKKDPAVVKLVNETQRIPLLFPGLLERHETDEEDQPSLLHPLPFLPGPKMKKHGGWVYPTNTNYARVSPNPVYRKGGYILPGHEYPSYADGGKIEEPKASKAERQKAYNTIAPTGGIDPANYYRYLFNIPRDTANIDPTDPNERAWKQYLGEAQDQFPIASYGYYGVKTPGEKVYKLDPEAEKDLFQTLTQKMKGVQRDTSFTMNETQVNPQKYPIEKLSPYSVLQNFTVSKGKDDKGTYVAYGDSYDFDSFLPPARGILESLGTPYKFYNRYYYPEVKDEMGKPLKYGDPKYNQFYGPSNFEKYYRPSKAKGGKVNRLMAGEGLLVPPAGMFDTGMQRADATRTAAPQVVQNTVTAKQFQSDLRNPRVTESQFKDKHGISREEYRNRPTEFAVGMNQIWEGAKEPFKFIGADPDLIRENPAEGIPQALAGTLMAELPVNEMYQATKQGISGLRKALGTESGLLSNTYKINPWAFKPQEGMMYRGLGKEGMEDAIQSGVFRPKQYGYAEGRSLAERVTTPKQFGSTFYAPTEKFGVVENYGPSYLAEVPFEGNQFAKRYGRKDWSWSTPRQIPTNEGRILQKDWLKGYKEVPKPTTVEDLVDLYRVQQKGAKTFAQLAAEGKIPQAFNTPEVLARKADEEKYFGQWFTNDKADLEWYMKDREFTNPEIIQLRVPKSKLSQYQNYNKTLSRAPEREFVIPYEEQKIYKQPQIQKQGGKVTWQIID